MLPLKFIRVSNDMSICATRILAIMSTHAYQARRMIKEEKKSDTLLNAAGRDAVRSAIILDNGTVIASPYSIGRLLSNIDRADAKHTKSKRITLSSALKLYDVIPDEIYNNEIEEAQEVEANPDLSEDENEDENLDIDTYDDDIDDNLDVLNVAWDGDGDEE